MASIQRIFPNLTTNALSFVGRPTSGLGQWDQVAAVYSGTGARYVGPQVGTAQQQATPSFVAIPNGATHKLMLAQFLSDPLRAVLIAAQVWEVAFAAQLANAGATFTWEPYAALFVMTSTGVRRATIFDVSSAGVGARVLTTERTCLAAITGLAAQVRAGDCLCLELGIAVTNTAAALAPQASIYTQGTQPISSDDVAASSAMTVLESPQALLLSLPQAGEQPGASVTQPDAIRQLKEAFPPRSASLYDWDASDALASKIMAALGIVVKLYGFDQSDRVFREVNPLTTVELLPTWEALLGITLADAVVRVRSADQRRQTVLARLRELGPLTIHNLAAIFAALVGYAQGTSPDVLEISSDFLRPANLWTESLPAGSTIPIDTGFGTSNLVRYTPTPLDGGVVWNAGAQVTLDLSASDTSGLRVQLTGPDGTVAQWEGGPSGVTSQIYLRSPAHADRAVHGPWRLNAYRIAGAPAVDLQSWTLYVSGKGHGGRGQAKWWWGVYFDSAHQTGDVRDIESALDRVTQSYARGYRIYSLSSSPGTVNHRAGLFIPGS